MQFHHIPNAAVSKEADRPLMQKEVYPVSSGLQHYLQQYQKDVTLPLSYRDLHHYEYTNAIKNDQGKHTHWERVVYNQKTLASLQQQLQQLYFILTGNPQPVNITAIDFCEFANSMPFRIHFTTATGKKDCFYVKSADASRIYGLELEQLLTSNPIYYLCHQNTLVEEHISGIPGDDFWETVSGFLPEQKKQLATAFVAFNEQCFARLLGDMRSYNFVVASNTDGAFTLRAIDFDQQCYEGRLNLYLPQFYKENHAYVQLITEHLSPAQIEDTRMEERKKLAALMAQKPERLRALLRSMSQDELSENYKVVSLRNELNQYHDTTLFSTATTMGQLVTQQLQVLTRHYLAVRNGILPTI